ncbi:MAG: methyltransferase domain-containing protein, partial [Halieaceae bacterium]|nr:methyltransferase domain-containing protein [Halieaceae bacterium]
MGSKRSDIHDRVLNADSLEEIEKAYREWAEDYESDLVDLAGYVAPAICADALLNCLPDNSATVLDAGCGTGLVGERLAEAGVARIDGLDYSTDMLKRAA